MKLSTKVDPSMVVIFLPNFIKRNSTHMCKIYEMIIIGQDMSEI